MSEPTTANPGLTRDSRLVRRPELTLYVHSNGAVEIHCDGGHYQGGVHTLTILDAFTEPRALGEVVDRIEASSARDFATITSTILELAANGILVREGENELSMPDYAGGWDGSSIHAKMLCDVQRTESFFNALSEIVKPDDVVVDIGTGTGVLALAALRAGARRVFAIESSSIANVAELMFERNASTEVTAPRVELIRGWSTRVDLPERASVLVSETVGNQALGEEIIESVLDANARLLTPDARRIPSRIRILAQPCEASPALRTRHTFTKENEIMWGRLYDLDFSSLRARDADKPFLLIVELAEARGWRKLGEPVVVADIDLANPQGTFETSSEALISEPGDLTGMLEFFELTLSPSITFDGHPDRVSDACSWHFPTWILPTARPVVAGQRIPLRYRYRAGRGKLSIGAPSARDA